MRAVPFFAGCLMAAAAGAAAAQPAPTRAQPAPAPAQPAPAQPAPAPPQPQAEPPADAPPPLTPAPLTPAEAAPPAHATRDDAGWRLYHGAFDALLQGKRKRATGLAAQLRREHAGHPATGLVASSPLALAGSGERRRRAPVEEPGSGARAELALFQTLHGLVLGVEACVALDCDDDEAILGLSLVGGLAGAVTSLALIGPITSGQRALLNSGTGWGAFNAAMALIALEPDSESDIAAGMIIGQTSGLFAGALLFNNRPTAGQVGLASTAAQWAAVLMGLTLASATKSPGSEEVSLSLLVAADVGLAVGVYLGRLRPDISRAQTYAIDAGGLVGGVAGGGLGVLLSGDIEDRSTAALAAVGVAGGLAAATYFTRNWGDDGDGDGDGDGDAHATVMPAEHGRGGLLGLAGTW